jgi:hypothetical protein
MKGLARAIKGFAHLGCIVIGRRTLEKRRTSAIGPPLGPHREGAGRLDGTDAHMQGDGRDCPMRVDAAPEGSCCGIEIANALPSAVLNSTT